MFLAGVHWAYFAAVITAAVGLITAVIQSRSTSWQLLADYQYRRIDTFLDPAQSPLDAGYHITQATIALGSGGWTGRGFMQKSTQISSLTRWPKSLALWAVSLCCCFTRW